MTMDVLENIRYYSIFCPQYDKDLIDFDLLSEIRQNFFVTGKKQKNKITRDHLGKTYHYSYALEKNKPMKWKRMFADKVIERSRVNNDGTYEIIFFNENRTIFKIVYFNFQHDIYKIEYFSHAEKRKVVLILKNKGNKIIIKEYKRQFNKVVSYEVYPVNLDINEDNADPFENKFAKFLCFTDKGMISYCTKDQLEKIEKTKKSSSIVKFNDMKNKEIVDNKINEVSVNLMNIKDKDVSYNKKYDIKNSVFPHDETMRQKIIKTENGEKFYYFGELKSNLRDGRGITITEDGFVAYDGEYAEDKKNGFGVFHYRSGAVNYVGNFKNDKKDLLGISFNKDHSRAVVRSFDNGKSKNMISEFDSQGNLLYAGRIENGEKVGAAVSYKNDDSKVFVLQFKNGIQTGRGSIFNEDGALVYNGEISDYQGNGLGVEYNLDGTIKYKGNFLNNKYSGQGKLYIDNGYIIEGNFENGFANGMARKFDTNSKKIYEGSFKDGVYSGEGTLYLDDGHFLKGTFINGIAQGILSEFDAQGDVTYIGHFENGVYEGNGCIYKNGKKVYEGNFKNGEYDGVGCLYKDDNCIYFGELTSGKKNGFGTEYCLGDIQYTGYFRDGLYDGIGIFFNCGIPLYAGFFKCGKKNGRVNEIYKNRVIKECIYDNDVVTYMKEYEYPSMNLLYYGNVCNNTKSGMGSTFTAFAEKDKEGIFDNGEIVNRMDVFFKELIPLPECSRLNDAGYDDFRFGPDFAVEKKLMDGIYSGQLMNGKPEGRGTILYSDHRYTGYFKNGQPYGKGVIYKNDGTKIQGEFLNEATNLSERIDFSTEKSYDLISIC